MRPCRVVGYPDRTAFLGDYFRVGGDTFGTMDCGFQALNEPMAITRLLWLACLCLLPPYSRRNVTLGSSRLARRPGIATAANAENANNASVATSTGADAAPAW
jgi:hypothetical protein